MTQVPMAASKVGRIHTAGAVCLAAGLGGAVASIYLAMGSPVEAESFMYPHPLAGRNGTRASSAGRPRLTVIRGGMLRPGDAGEAVPGVMSRQT
jgi:hypothetical protein